jgi:GNAT superfamily N-acetyltransferase
MAERLKTLLQIREAEATDLPALQQLYRQLNDGRPPALSQEHAEQLFLRIANYPDYRIYLGELEGEVVATFALLIMDSLGHDGVPSAVLEDVVVCETRRGQGIGEQLIAFATELAGGKGCSKFFLSSGSSRVGAHAFYRKLGFIQHGYSFYLDLQPEQDHSNRSRK